MSSNSSEQQLLARAGKQNGRREGVVTHSSTTEEAQKNSHKKESIPGRFQRKEARKNSHKKESIEGRFQKKEASKKDSRKRNHFIESGSKKGPSHSHSHPQVNLKKTFNPVTIEARKMLFWANS